MSLFTKKSPSGKRRNSISELQTYPNLHTPLSVSLTAIIPYERVQIWVCLFLYGCSLPRCEAPNLGVFDLCHFDLLKQGRANSGGF